MEQTTIDIIIEVERGELEREKALEIVRSIMLSYPLNAKDVQVMLICKQELNYTLSN